MTSLGLGPGGEFDHIRTIAARLGTRATGLGDDCAVVEWPGKRGAGHFVLSTDLTIEGIHFRRSWLSPQEIGSRAAAAALSDLAATGAQVIGVLVSLGVPEEDQALIEPIMDGVGAAVDGVGGVVLGGDLSRAPAVTVDVCVVGTAARPIGRGGALPGDTLWVTGRLGGARAAITLWDRGETLGDEVRAAFAAPVPRLATGEWLAAAGAHAMIDVSDGLASDVRHLATRSGVSVVVTLEDVPLGPGVTQAAGAVDEPAPVFAAVGGEDYELLVALPPEFTQANATECTGACGVELTPIGRIEEGTEVRLMLHGEPRRLAGYDHFA